jgi:hypothetical protein
MTKLSLERVREHNLSLAAGSATGKEKSSEVREFLEKDLARLAKDIVDVRRGNVEDSFGRKVSPYHISLSEAVKSEYGIPDLKSYLKQLGIYMGEDTLASVARRLGQDNFSKTMMEQLMIDTSNFNSAPNSTKSVADDYRFIIPEIFGEAVRTGYQHASLHQSWIAGTTNMNGHKMTMPRIERGDGVPSIVAEGADMPIGSIKFGKKDVKIFKIGTGFLITDELVMDSRLDHLFIFLGEVGNDMAIGADVQAIKILVNGEQADGSESSPVIGVDTINSIKTVDCRTVMSRMARLKKPITHGILNEVDSLIDLNAAMPEREETHIDEYMKIKADNWILPGNQLMFLNSAQAMVKLQYRGLVTERRRNPRNQTEEMFISDHINFAIVKRDARVILDKDLAFSSQGFPPYMDIDSRINVAFNEL